MDQDDTSSFYVIDKQTSSQIVWRCTYKSCSGRLKVNRKDNSVISSKPHNHDSQPRCAVASNEIDKIFCLDMNKYVVVAGLAIALLLGALIGGVIAHFCTLYKLGYYEGAYNEDNLAGAVSMLNGNHKMVEDKITNNSDKSHLINGGDVPHETFSNDLVNVDNSFHDPVNIDNSFHDPANIDNSFHNPGNIDNSFHNTHHQSVLQQNNRNSLETINTNFNSVNPQTNSNNNPNFHNQGNNGFNNNGFQNVAVDPRRPNELQQNTHLNAVQNQVNRILNPGHDFQGNIANTGTHHNTDMTSNPRFQINSGIQNQGAHNQVRQIRQRMVQLQSQQTQPFNQNNFHRNVNQNVHQGQHMHGHSVNRGSNQHTHRNINSQNFQNQQFLHGNNEGIEILSTDPSFQSSFTLQSMSMIKEDDPTTSQTASGTQQTGIFLQETSSHAKEQMAEIGSEMADLSIVKAATASINIRGLTMLNEESNKSLDALPKSTSDITTVIEKTIGFNHNLSQNHSEFISKPLHPTTGFPNIETVEAGTVKSSQLSDINIEGVNVNNGFPIRNDPKPDMKLSSINLNGEIPLSTNRELHSNTDTVLFNREGVSMVNNGLNMAIQGLSLIEHDINPQNIELKNQIEKMQETLITDINLLPSLNVSHRFSLGSSPNSHANKDISFSFVKSQPSLPSAIHSNTTPLDKKSLLVSTMPRQLTTNPVSHTAQGSNIRQLMPKPVLPTSQGTDFRQLVPTQISHSAQQPNFNNLVPKPVLPPTQASNPIILVTTPITPAIQVTNAKQLVPTPSLPSTLGTNNKQLVPSPVSPPTQGTNNKPLVPSPVSLPTQGTNNKQLVPSPVSPAVQMANRKQLVPTPLSPSVQRSNAQQIFSSPILTTTQGLNNKKPISNSASSPLDSRPKFVRPPTSSQNIELSSQSNPVSQQKPLINNIQANSRSKSSQGINSENPNRSDSGRFEMEEIKNYILKSVSTENLRNNLKELSRLPHQAGSPRERQLANLIRARFLASGCDTAELVPYDVLLSKTDPSQNNRVSLHTEGGVGEEVWAAQSVILPNEELQAFSPYSPSGKVMTAKGEAVVYVNYGEEEDFKHLDSIGTSLSGRVVMARTVIYVSGMDLVRRAVSRGARGVILYADPAEVVNPGDTTVYPNSTSLPGDAVKLRVLRSGQGDPLTPGWPSKSWSHRLLEENLKSLPSIPVQPISYNDAKVILQKLGGPASPATWHGKLTDVSYNIGPTMTSDFSHLNLCLATYNQLNRKTIYNVIGTIRGEVEPDRYVILGNHRDAWAYGAIDPSSGTSQMLETAAVLGQLKAKGWRPRRTVVYASWGAEEFGKIGSTEWVEEHLGKLQERGVAYINVDICATGPILAHSASPVIRDVLVDMAKLVPGIGSSGGTIYDEWREYSLRVDKTEPKPWHLGTGTDYSAFSFFSGVPSLGMGFMRNSTDIDVPMYPAYHTGIETFHLVDTFIDPGFTIHQGCSRLSALTLVRLAEAPVVPMDPHYLPVAMEEALTEMKKKGLHDVLMGTLGVQTLPTLEESILSFKRAANAFLARIKNQNYTKDPMILRGINDQLTRLEQKFLMPQGSEDKPWCRQAVFAPSRGSPFGKWGFPALKDLLVGLENLHGTELSQQHHLIEKHVSDLILMTSSAISSLNHLHVI